MIPAEIYELARALEEVDADPCDEAITEAWRLHRSMTARGLRLSFAPINTEDQP